MGAQVSMEPEVKMDTRILKEAMAEFIEFAGTGGFVLIFSIGYNYGKLVINKELPNDTLGVREVLQVVRKWSKVSVKTSRDGELLIVGSKDPFTVGFVCGCFSKVAEDFRVDYEDNRALVYLTLKEGVLRRSKVFSIFSFGL